MTKITGFDQYPLGRKPLHFQGKQWINDCFMTVLTAPMRIVRHFLLHFDVFTTGWHHWDKFWQKVQFVAPLDTNFDSFSRFWTPGHRKITVLTTLTNQVSLGPDLEMIGILGTGRKCRKPGISVNGKLRKVSICRTPRHCFWEKCQFCHKSTVSGKSQFLTWLLWTLLLSRGNCDGTAGHCDVTAGPLWR